MRTIIRILTRLFYYNRLKRFRVWYKRENPSSPKQLVDSHHWYLYGI
ncbi:MAG: hypothetical protein AAF587_35460 [Bacteroidota bacterium]